jgi:hypothetical protein
VPRHRSSPRPGRALTGLAGQVGAVAGQLPLVLHGVLPAEIGGVSVLDDHRPLRLGALQGTDPDDLSGHHHRLATPPAIDSSPRIGGVMADGQQAAAAERPPGPAAIGPGGPQAPGKGEWLVGEEAPDARGAPQGFERLEEPVDRGHHALVGVQDQGTSRVVDGARRRMAAELPLVGLGPCGPLPPEPEGVPCGVAPGALEAQEDAVVNIMRSIAPLMLDDAGVRPGAQIEPPVPIGVGA